MNFFPITTTLRTFQVEALDAGDATLIALRLLIEGETIVQPRHDHDCDHCRFVGHDGDVDCYVCEDSVIRRNSSEPSDYGSFPVAIATQVPCYARVLAMAEKEV